MSLLNPATNILLQCLDVDLDSSVLVLSPDICACLQAEGFPDRSYFSDPP